jgi:hypothetical protein
VGRRSRSPAASGRPPRARRPADVGPAVGPAEDSLETALPRVLKIVGTVVAPTTLLTGLLFYFGRLHITGFFGYLRVNFTVLDLTVQDYLIRSADGLFMPFTIAAAGALLVLWSHGVLLAVLPPQQRQRLLRIATPLAACLGLLLVGLAVAAVVGDAPVLNTPPEIGGLSLAFGTLLLAYAAHLARILLAQRLGQRAPRSGSAVVAEWGAAFVLVSVGLFWSVSSYAIGVGTGRAQQTEAQLADWPSAVVFSERSLSLSAPGVREVRCHDSEAAYHFRYSGLKLIFQSGNQYVFLPSDWTHDQGPAILIPRSDTLRLEFRGADQPVPDTC